MVTAETRTRSGSTTRQMASRSHCKVPCLPEFVACPLPTSVCPTSSRLLILIPAQTAMVLSTWYSSPAHRYLHRLASVPTALSTLHTTSSYLSAPLATLASRRVCEPAALLRTSAPPTPRSHSICPTGRTMLWAISCSLLHPASNGPF